MNADVEIYVTGLAPETIDDLLVGETISRSAFHRHEIAEAWNDLADEERELVNKADAVLIANAERVAEFWTNDDIAIIREREQPAKEAWWWWLHEVADGTYPADLLPGAIMSTS